MSSAIEAVPAKSEQTTSHWSLWLRQIGAIFRMEIEKNFLGRRAILIYLHRAAAALSVVDFGARHAAG